MQRRFMRYAIVMTVAGLSVAACKGTERAAGERDTTSVARSDSEITGRIGRTGNRETPTPGAGERARGAERTGTLGAGTPAPMPAKTGDVRDFRLGAGTTVELRNSVEINSRNNRTGAPVTASAQRAVYSARGDTVVPAGAEFVGRVTALKPAERPGLEGTMHITFDSVRLNGRTLPIEARVVEMGTITKGRGVTAGDAAKVGAGAVIGGVAGRVIGGDRRGTIIGAATGAAAGAIIAHNTRDIDIVLPVGAPVRIELTRVLDATRAYAVRR